MGEWRGSQLIMGYELIQWWEFCGIYEIWVFFFFFLETNTHTRTQGREKEVLIQRHTTTPLKSHGNF